MTAAGTVKLSNVTARRNGSCRQTASCGDLGGRDLSPGREGLSASGAIIAKQIGKDLGVRYGLEGSAQRDQNRGRVKDQSKNLRVSEDSTASSACLCISTNVEAVIGHDAAPGSSVKI